MFSSPFGLFLVSLPSPLSISISQHFLLVEKAQSPMMTPRWQRIDSTTIHPTFSNRTSQQRVLLLFLHFESYFTLTSDFVNRI